MLKTLRKLGYEAGSGVMIDIPGQTYASLSYDIDLFRKLNLDMIGVGPYLPHPRTPLGQGDGRRTILTRIVCPDANIPSTTALATVNRERGRELGLMRGANVVMPNLTPLKYRPKYEIYPSKACITEVPSECHTCLYHRIGSIGRKVGIGQGDRIHRFG